MVNIEELEEFYTLVFNNILDGYMTRHDLMLHFGVSWEVATRIIEIHEYHDDIT